MDSLHVYKDDWTRTSSRVFWGEIAPCDHVVQIYENDDVFLDLLSSFVTDGLRSSECVTVIATDVHLKALNQRLDSVGYNIHHLLSTTQYMPLDADECLSKFMVNDWPDEGLFMDFVNEVISKAKSKKRTVRAFGEMVAILWAKGLSGATIRLEHLWNKFCETEAFCLFCAYPRSGFTQEASESVLNICGAHSKMVAGFETSKTEVFYKSLD